MCSSLPKGVYIDLYPNVFIISYSLNGPRYSPNYSSSL